MKKLLLIFIAALLPAGCSVPAQQEIPELSDKDQLIPVYCRRGNRSGQAAE